MTTTSFAFATANHILFGPGSSDQVPALAAGLGDRVMVVLGRHTDPDDHPGLNGLPASTVWHRWSGEPTLVGVDDALATARRTRPDVLIGWGGGSVIDVTKAVAVLALGTGQVIDHLELVGGGQPVPTRSIPLIAVPTTAGTGAEVTANAPVLVPEHRVKVSLRGAGMLPTFAVVDPQLTVTAPASVTAATGLDALTQNLESLCSARATAISDLLATDGLSRAARGLRPAYADGTDLTARTEMSLSALLSGMALANSGLGAVHGLAAPLGGMTGAAHGELCAAVLPAVCEINIRALTDRLPSSPALARYTRVAQLLTGDPAAQAQDGVAWLRETVALLHVPGLDQLGLDRAEHRYAAEAALRASSMKGNPIALTREEVVEILDRSV